MMTLAEFGPTWVQVHAFMLGANSTLSLVAALLFFRFYRRTSDRLFLFFAASFGVMGMNRVAFLMFNGISESEPAWYLVRLFAFGLIVYAIVDKNRGGKRRA